MYLSKYDASWPLAQRQRPCGLDHAVMRRVMCMVLVVRSWMYEPLLSVLFCFWVGVKGMISFYLKHGRANMRRTGGNSCRLEIAIESSLN